jgi:hypothetical protein
MKLLFNFHVDGENLKDYMNHKYVILYECYVPNIFISMMEITLGRKSGHNLITKGGYERFDRGELGGTHLHAEKLSHSCFRIKNKKEDLLASSALLFFLLFLRFLLLLVR